MLSKSIIIPAKNEEKNLDPLLSRIPNFESEYEIIIICGDSSDNTLGISESGLRTSTDRLSGIEVNTIDNNMFRPINISPDIRNAFRENASAIGESDPLEAAIDVIINIQSQMRDVSLQEPQFPFIENPLLPSSQETPVTPNTLNLPNIDSNLISNTVNNSLSNLSTSQKLAILFGRD